MSMPQITMLSVRTAEQKRKIAQRVTDVTVEDTGAVREGFAVAFYEASKENYACCGVLTSDR